MCLQIYCGTILNIKLATKFPWKIQKSGRMAEQQWSFCWAIGCPVPTYSFAPHSRLNISKNNTFMWKPTGTQITQFRLLKPETYVGLLKLKCYTLLVNTGHSITQVVNVPMMLIMELFVLQEQSVMQSVDQPVGNKIKEVRRCQFAMHAE